jgi:hypothetical protein
MNNGTVRENARLYRIYRGMKNRCGNPKRKNYKYYGGKGIRVCQEWSRSWLSFHSWAMLHGYADDLSIDRINPRLGYEPNNCQFIPLSENIRKANTKPFELLSKRYQRRVARARGIELPQPVRLRRSILIKRQPRRANGLKHDDIFIKYNGEIGEDIFDMHKSFLVDVPNRKQGGAA